MRNYIKRIILGLAFFVMLASELGGVQGVCAATSKISLSLNCRRAVIMDLDSGKVLYKKNANQKCHNASTTKLMTAIVAVENNKSLNKKVRISYNASASNPGGSTSVRIGMSTGDRYRMKDLLHAMLLKSANDSAVAVAEGTSGSVTKFMKVANRTAKRIGCKNTVFGTPNGLRSSATHHTTAYDMALIMRHAYNNEQLRNIMKKKTYSFRSVNGRYHSVTNTNLLLGSKDYYCIGKTGYGWTADYCFAGVYTYKGHSYVVVALGSGSEGSRWGDTKKMISACKTNAKEVAKTLELNKTTIELTEGDTYQLKVKKTKGTPKWSVKNESIASVDENGQVTGKSAGTTTVYATLYGKKLQCKVRVTKPVTEESNEAVSTSED
ncbi:MAG: D-alanyl-D-alanine carboxypeptidase [Lachnospiraceae bacterium]|nr:D-alanyl-D-alanine carboxypeptidase [Lachnospiraceae bacterium]